MATSSTNIDAALDKWATEFINSAMTMLVLFISVLLLLYIQIDIHIGHLRD